MTTQPIPAETLRVLVTGGARGIGAATARLLAEAGAQVMVADVLDEEGEALAAELGERVVYQSLDVTKEADWRAAVAAAKEAFGGLNALFNNAGILAYGGVETCTPGDFRKVLDVNLYGAFLGLHVCAPVLREAGGGVIVNTSSTAGLQGYAGLAAYVSSKWGVRGLTKAAALDLSEAGIRVVSLHPGPITTPMTSDFGQEMVEAQPMPRFGEADEVARMVRFLMTEATFSTGSEFVIDGGAVTGQKLHMPD
ncbi:SDR family oxidoreductase [Henriciella aquimarina]|uniref:SDR family oxidoreductase n=1 Tax=Henriciella aquimarina TaxID=545261 RepID=UPI0009FF9520|nr:SDR family oxidoreductase [Henriciella aquimarina]